MAGAPATNASLQLQVSTRWLNAEVMAAVGMVMILLVMVLPLPPFMLDMLLATNVAVSLAVLLTAFYATRPLDFAIFPGLLLITTLFRLSLNVASTRAILTHGEAGKLIEAFGQIVVAGNYVVGGIIFLVLVLINFTVITKGSGRIAEVAARFTLDALPGKQMAIDADLNAGLIDEAAARRRRSEVGREADFYGAMDGASKFVRGDAVAGLIITFINIIGGLIIGVFQMDLPAGEAAQKFTLLSIGDGLVSQIPSLLISTAAGIIVSRASSDGNISSEISQQLLGKAHPLFITGIFLAFLGIMPGIPLIPFWLLAAGLILMAQQRMSAARKTQSEPEPVVEEPVEPHDGSSDLQLVDPLELEIGYALISIVDPGQKGDLLERVKMLRQQLAMELGIVIPPVRIRDNVGLGANQYVIKLRGNPIGEGEVLPGYHLALLPDELGNPPPGIRVQDPTFGLPALWIAERNLPDAERLGLTVVEAPAVITTHLLEVLRKNAHRLLDRQEVKKLIDRVKESSPALVDELVPNVLTIGTIQKVFKRLLQERIPIRDLVSVLEALADNAPNVKSVDVLTEYVRAALSPTISRQFASMDGKIHTFVLDPLLEQHLIEKAQTGELNPSTLGLMPERAERFIQEVDRMAKRLISAGHPPVLLTTPVLRPTLFSFISPLVPDLAVLSYNDLTPDASIEVLDQLRLP